MSASCFSSSVHAQSISDVQHQLLKLSLKADEEVVVELPFEVQAFAANESHHLEHRVLESGVWSEWIEFVHEEPEWEDSSLVFSKGIQAMMVRSHEDLNLTLTAMRFDDQLQVASTDISGLLAAEAYDSSSEPFRVIPRAEWGANEGLGIYVPKPADEFLDPDSDEDSGGQKGPNTCAPLEEAYPGQFQLQQKVIETDSQGQPYIWPRRYSAQVKKIVIHHTALVVRDFNDDGIVGQSDYKSAVNAIYTYHTRTRGWGDIGYHFIVDPDGRVYEGRAGGPFVLAAHVLCQNTSMVGVAMLGNFEEERVPKAAFNGLVEIVKQLVDQYGITPNGKSKFRGAVIPHIVTHADIGDITKSHIGHGATQCPGRHLERVMPQLRAAVTAGGVTPDKDFRQSTVLDGQQVSALSKFSKRVMLKNDGIHSWSHLKITPVGSSVAVYDQSIRTTIPGESVEVTLQLESGFESGEQQQEFVVEVNGEALSRKLTVTYRVQGLDPRYELLEFRGIDRPILIGEEREVMLRLKNTGNFTWKSTGDYPVALHQVIRRGTRVDLYRRGLKLELERDVAPGESVTFEFQLPRQTRAGRYRAELLPMIDKDKGFKGESLEMKLSVEAARFGATVRPFLQEQRLRRGYQEELTFLIENTGNMFWETGTLSYSIQGQPKKLVDVPLNPGQSLPVKLMIPVQIADKSHDVSIQLAVENIPDGLQLSRIQADELSFEYSFPVSGAALLKGEVLLQSDLLIPSERGVYELWADIKNLGNVPWYGKGANRVTLNLQDRGDFTHRSWKRRRIAAFLDQDVVMPGETGRFHFQAQVRRQPVYTSYDEFAPQIGNYKVNLKGGPLTIGAVGQRGERVSRSSGEVFEIRAQQREQREQERVEDATLGLVPPMRVWLTGFIFEQAQVTSPGSYTVWRSDTGKQYQFAGGSPYFLAFDELKNGTIFRIRADESEYLEFQNWDRKQSFGQNINDNKFRNILEFRAVPVEKGSREMKMIAINELPLEDYMKGIAEVPESDDQPEEKRKTIAVLARSYALHYLISEYKKFPGQPYNAADSPAIFQKYLGYGFEQRAPKWLQAVEDTAREVITVDRQRSQESGQFLPFEQRVLRAAYFSCTDGVMTKAGSEVWPTNAYFQRFSYVFQPVSDSIGDDPGREGLQACGHQVGLSGYGATQKATSGSTYQEIIQGYYQDIGFDKYR